MGTASLHNSNQHFHSSFPLLSAIELVRNGYAFSDGNGVMGIDVARAIQEAYGLSFIPGAAQIRIGGIKGMLSLKLDFKPSAIGIRPSQVSPAVSS